MKYRYNTTGTCSKVIEFDLSEDGFIADVVFYGGCDGNLKGICSLVQGMKAEDAIKKLSGIRCGMKSTSCPDQLACALSQALKK